MTVSDKIVEKAPWWKTFFNDIFYDWWVNDPGRDISGQAQKIIDALGLKPPAQILDVGCGAGPLARELVGRGFSVVGIDLSETGIGHAVKNTSKDVYYARADMRMLPFRQVFDGAYIAGGSFGYFEDDANRQVLKELATALKPGARCWVDMPSRDWIIANFLPQLFRRIDDDTVILIEGQFDPRTSRLNGTWTIVRRGEDWTLGDTSIRLYSPHELVKMCEIVGLDFLSVGELEDGKPYSSRTKLLAQKPL